MSVKRTGSLDQALNRLLASDKMHVKAGVMAGSKYPDGTSVATVAYKNEYGFENIPSRAFIRTTIKDEKKNWGVLARQCVKAGYSIEKVLSLVGLQMANDIQQSIMTWTTPPNSAYTVAKKGFNAPLRDTMLMHDSITFELEEGNIK